MNRYVVKFDHVGRAEAPAYDADFSPNRTAICLHREDIAACHPGAGDLGVVFPGRDHPVPIFYRVIHQVVVGELIATRGKLVFKLEDAFAERSRVHWVDLAVHHDFGPNGAFNYVPVARFGAKSEGVDARRVFGENFRREVRHFEVTAREKGERRSAEDRAKQARKGENRLVMHRNLGIEYRELKMDILSVATHQNRPTLGKFPLDAAFASSPLGLYVHVPFCASTCDFCAFYQTAPTRERVVGYLEDVARELALVSWRRPVDTVFWGGGTPGLLAPEDLQSLGRAVLAGCGARPLEWSVELAPASVNDARLAVLRDLGVTRVSLGVQSFSPALLDALGRQHTREQVYRAYERVRAAGFASVNLDLMFALPGQDEAAWLEDLRAAVILAPDHISTYCLTFEEDTKLWVKLSKGQVKLDEAREARLYEHTWDELESAGYAQYEVSNFARPGHSCHHNLNTWRMHEWVGIGPSAAGQHGGLRGGNPADLEKWGLQSRRGQRMTEDRVVLSPALLSEDALVFGLRLNAGVDVAAVRERFGGVVGWSDLETELARLADEGLLEPTAEGSEVVRLTRRGRLLADAVGSTLMGVLRDQAKWSESVPP